MGILTAFSEGISNASLAPTPYYITVVVLALVTVFFFQKRLQDDFPTINQYPGDWFRRKAKRDFVTRANALLDEGEQKYAGKPFRIITTLGEKVILPRSYFRWIKSHPDLDHQEQVAEEFFGAYAGFEGIGAFNDPNGFVIDLVKKHMSSLNATVLARFEKEADKILEEELTDADEYHEIQYSKICKKLILRLSALVFVGPRLAYDEEWQTIASTYTANLFQACRSLRVWPRPLRSIAVWFIPECATCRQQVKRARAKLASITPSEAERDTAMNWVNPRADIAAVQLALAAGALHTTTQLLNQCVLDLAYSASDNQDIIERLRDEYDSVMMGSSTGTIAPSVLPKLNLLEACIKETQRLKPQTLTNLERLATKPIVLPDGVKISRGTMISISSAPMWDPKTWGADANLWKPSRYYSTDALSSKRSFVSSDENNFAFGVGRFICPGRFMVNAELKVILSRMLQGWDIRLKEAEFRDTKANGLGRIPWLMYGFEMLANENVTVEVKRRT